MTRTKTFTAFLAAAGILLLAAPLATAAPEVTVSGTTVMMTDDERVSSGDLCRFARDACTLPIVSVEASSYSVARPPSEATTHRQPPFMAGTEMNAQAGALSVGTGAVALVVAPPPPPPGPGPCGVGCVPPWIVALRDWGMSTACSAASVCGRLPGGPVDSGPIIVVGEFGALRLLP